MGDPREDPGYFEDEPFVEEIIIEPKTGNGKAKALRFQLRPFEAIKLSTEPNYRIKGILPRVGLVVVWGPPKCGKSFWTFDLVMHVALGWKYRGRKVQQGTVVYLALEGGAGFARRVEAWRQHHLADHHQPVPFHLLDVPVDLIADHKALIEDIGAQIIAMPAIVVIDTLNRSLNGSENKPEDMARYIRAADSIRSAFGCLVIIIHHCGVIGSRPRGHTSLTGADDAQIAVYRDKDGNITVEVEHMKGRRGERAHGQQAQTRRTRLRR
jgi:RecA-family ATPase